MSGIVAGVAGAAAETGGKIVSKVGQELSPHAKASARRLGEIIEKAVENIGRIFEAHPADTKALSETAMKVGEDALTTGKQIVQIIEKPVLEFVERNSARLDELGKNLSPEFIEKMAKALEMTGEQLSKEIQTKGFLNLVRQSADSMSKEAVQLLRQLVS